jgi:D-3-phosphoglycerate dehydrogenase
VRSATRVTAEVLEAAPELVVVGRAGIGLDNVDVAFATRRGVMVVNAPQSNVVSAAEHTMALILAQARNVPQAHAALVAGRWERSRWEGVELADKTLGIVGLGRIGKLVAQRALAFGMRLVAFDPTSRPAGSTDVRGAIAAPWIGRRRRLHHDPRPRTKETIGLFDARMLRSAARARIVSVRGGIDESALAEAIAKTVAGPPSMFSTASPRRRLRCSR